MSTLTIDDILAHRDTQVIVDYINGLWGDINASHDDGINMLFVYGGGVVMTIYYPSNFEETAKAINTSDLENRDFVEKVLMIANL